MNTAVESYGIRCQLKAERVDKDGGVIYGVTVAKANVNALGKYVYLDANGQLTRDPEGARKKLQVKTDGKTLDTLMGAAQDAGGRVKSREDHDDSIGARAGFADNFRMIGDRVICDLHVFDSYANRQIVFETAAKTPDDIGLSIDMDPSFEILEDCALMRIAKLNAVDIVDAGAITPAGLFLHAEKSVDNQNNSKTSTTMAEQKEPTVADCMSAISELAKKFAAYAEANPSKKGTDSDGDNDAMKAVKELQLQLAATNESIANMKKENAALGLQFKAASGGDQAGEAERMRLAKEKEDEAGKNKPYLQLVQDAVQASAGKMKASDAHREVQRAHPDAYKAHLASKGAIKL